MNLSLYTVQALIILDSEANRLYARYHTPPHTSTSNTTDDNTTDESEEFSTVKQQRAFEKQLFEKTYKDSADILLFQGHLVVYKQVADVIIYFVAASTENEVVLFEALEGFKDALDKILEYQLDKKSVLEHYDMVCIAADETIDDGIILETEPGIISARTSKAPVAGVDVGGLNGIELSEKGLFSAFQFARGKLAERLQQGL